MPPVAEEVGSSSRNAVQTQQQQQQQQLQAPQDDAAGPALGQTRARRSSKMEQYSSDKSAAKEFFKKEPCIHTHRMFDRAAKIFRGLKLAKEKQLERKGGGGGAEPALPALDFNGPTEKRLTFELAFSSLKCE